MNLDAWKILSASLVRSEGQDDGEDIPLALYKFRKHICHPTGGLPIYTTPLTSPSLDFVAHLVISGGCAFPVSQMLALADMKNLGVLELIQMTGSDGTATPEISDRLVRGWSEKDDPFPLLRILRVWGDQSVTQDSVRWVSRFPSLALYDVQAFREDWRTPHEVALEHGWEAVETSTGPGDSLLGYLTRLSPSEQRLQDLARTAESDLLALCSDSRCAVRFDFNRQAPPLLSYLEGTQKQSIPSWDPDVALSGARACHGIAFEAWAFWLYSIVGQLNQDRDLENRKTRPPFQALVGPFVLPSKPMACLFLGHNKPGGITSRPSYVGRGLFRTKKYLLTRRSSVQSDATVKSGDPTSAPIIDPQIPGVTAMPKVRRDKRRRIDDILQSMNRS